MANCEKFSQRVGFHAHQIEQQLDIAQRLEKQKQFVREQERKQRIVDEEKRQLTDEALTRKRFEGTGVIETFEEIRDQGILVLSKQIEMRKIRRFFSGEDVLFSESFEPAKIVFHFNAIDLNYERFESSIIRSDEYESLNSYFSGNKFLRVTVFPLENDSSFEVSSGIITNDKERIINLKRINGADETIDELARLVAIHKKDFSNGIDPSSVFKHWINPNVR